MSEQPRTEDMKPAVPRKPVAPKNQLIREDGGEGIKIEIFVAILVFVIVGVALISKALY